MLDAQGDVWVTESDPLQHPGRSIRRIVKERTASWQTKPTVLPPCTRRASSVSKPQASGLVEGKVYNIPNFFSHVDYEHRNIFFTSLFSNETDKKKEMKVMPGVVFFPSSY